MFKTRRNFLIYAILALCLMLIYFFRNTILNSNIHFLFSRPIAYINETLMPVSNMARNIITIFDVIKERDELRTHKIDSDFYMAQVDILKIENDLLREQLNLSKKNNYKLIEADIDIINNSIGENIVTINKGKNEGIEIGDALILPNYAIAGKIIKIFDNYSVAETIDDHNFIASVRIEGKNIVGDFKNSNKNEHIIDLVKSNEDIEIGGLIVTSGIDDLPQGLLVGEISEHGNDDGALFKKIKVKTFFENFKNPIVFIIKK